LTRAALSWFALALGVRALVALRTCVPARDAEAYLWMAAQVARGDFGAAFRSVFHPLHGILVAVPLWLWPGLDVVVAGQAVSILGASLAVLPFHRLVERRFGAAAAGFACAAYAIGTWFARHPADCLSEGPFHLLVASCALGFATGWPAGRTGFLAGLAYGLRPEAAAMVLLGAPWLALRSGWRSAVWLLLGFVAGACWWPLGWWWFGDGFTLTPKAAFNWDVGVGGADAGGGHYLAHALRVPGAAWEAVGFTVVPLAVLGLARADLRGLRDAAALWLGWFLLQCAVVPLLRSNLRFFAGYGMLLLPFAGIGMVTLLAWLRARPGWLRVLLIAVVALPDAVRLPQLRRADRVVERELGAWLRPRLRAGETIATEMPRLAFFAGLPPIPPRRIERDEILLRCRDPATRFAAVVVERTGLHAADLAPLGFVELKLPEALGRSVHERGVIVCWRPG
jgi:hypothetical protein